VQYPLPGYVAPASVAFSPDHKLVSYLYSTDNTLNRKVFAFDPVTCQRHLLVNPPGGGGVGEGNLSTAEKLRGERDCGRAVLVWRTTSGSREVLVHAWWFLWPGGVISLFRLFWKPLCLLPESGEVFCDLFAKWLQNSQMTKSFISDLHLHQSSVIFMVDYSEEYELNLELTIEGDVGNIYMFKMGQSCCSE
jgi:hypothetical protein